MKINDLKEFLQQKGQFSFSRSGGPGGQNVNKVNTKVLITISLNDLSFLFSTEEIDRIRNKLQNRINSQDELFLQFQEERSQLLNREKAIQSLAELILDSLILPKKRKKTKPSLASKIRRVESKKKNAAKKKSRGRITSYD